MIYMLLVALIFVFTAWWIVSVLLIVGLCLLFVNRTVLLKTDKRMLLSARRGIKQYKYLVIGDVCAPSRLRDFVSESEGVFAIMSPGRSLEASYQILLHTSSILERKGVCIILHNRYMTKKKRMYSIFDVPYFNLVTKKELGLERLAHKAHFPLFFEPLQSIRMLWKMLPINYKETDCPMDELKFFCRERDFTLIYLTK